MSTNQASKLIKFQHDSIFRSLLVDQMVQYVLLKDLRQRFIFSDNSYIDILPEDK